ncbi:MAG: hypothetical protein Q7S56_01315 [Nanoarchaeota archaeon]|nr:hypothetical protein [Nanoarchaeota archaeon]
MAIIYRRDEKKRIDYFVDDRGNPIPFKISNRKGDENGQEFTDGFSYLGSRDMYKQMGLKMGFEDETGSDRLEMLAWERSCENNAFAVNLVRLVRDSMTTGTLPLRPKIFTPQINLPDINKYQTSTQ